MAVSFLLLHQLLQGSFVPSVFYGTKQLPQLCVEPVKVLFLSDTVKSLWIVGKHSLKCFPFLPKVHHLRKLPRAVPLLLPMVQADRIDRKQLFFLPHPAEPLRF